MENAQVSAAKSQKYELSKKQFLQGYSCDFCSTRRDDASVILEHIVIRHSLFNKKCEYGRVFNGCMELRNHIKEIHISPIYKCNVCHHYFNYKCMLRIHSKSHVQGRNKGV